ncbi:MAG: hypothetical protein Kow00108_20880 [Calditrichia bacterium]
MNRSNLQIWFSTSYNHEDRQAFAGYVWKLGSEPIETGFHAISLGTVKDNVFADFKALEYLFPQLSKKILKNTISRRKIKLQIFSHNLTLTQTFQNLILPSRHEHLTRIVRSVKSECGKLYSVGIGWISRKENPAVTKLKEWLNSKLEADLEISSPDKYHNLNHPMSKHNFFDLVNEFQVLISELNIKRNWKIGEVA